MIDAVTELTREVVLTELLHADDIVQEMEFVFLEKWNDTKFGEN